MSRGRGKRLSADFTQGRVALEAAKGYKTASEIAQEYQVHPIAPRSGIITQVATPNQAFLIKLVKIPPQLIKLLLKG